jgi:hypothetical protein
MLSFLATASSSRGADHYQSRSARATPDGAGGVVEKLIYVVWKPDDVGMARFRQALLGPIGRQLLALGARGLAVNLADELAAPGLRITQMSPPLSGTVSIWLDTALNRGPIEAVLAGVTVRLAGYLALESVPIVDTTHTRPPGERLPGLYTVAFLERPDFLTYDEWLQRWQGEHTAVAIETQSTFLYIQNVLVRPLRADAPPWVAIVEEAFPAAAATDPMVFYNAGGSPDTLRAHQHRMMQSCQRFIDFSRFETHPMSAYVLRRPLMADG